MTYRLEIQVFNCESSSISHFVELTDSGENIENEAGTTRYVSPIRVSVDLSFAEILDLGEFMKTPWIEIVEFFFI